MPVSLDEIMREIPPDRRAEIERKAAALAADHRLRAGPGTEAPPPAPLRGSVGITVRTGQRCPESGIWRVENIPSATAPVAIHAVMPPYGNRTVTWVLVQPT